MSAPKLYLFDIEGTVAPVSFVTETLFPYARKHCEEFLWQVVPEIGNVELGDNPEGTIFMDMMLLALENRRETDPGAPRILPPEAANQGAVSMSPAKGIPRIVEYIYWLMDQDRKSTALKSLQGKIWKAGYERGELKSVLFDDVPGAFARWSKEAGIAIYSSGSAEAQVLFFRHSNVGDLTPMISGYFDTRIGPKQASASYVAIAQQMNVAPEDVLFFSDVVSELDAARAAGCGTRLMVRPGNAPVADFGAHAAIQSLGPDSLF
ncbi:MAG TPA: acireductone synthase [Terracidiphilus sp.]|jgi:2,3-diketo-5-methylthio-1-phosphopentane phosphatase